jgi:hypothetical protein
LLRGGATLDGMSTNGVRPNRNTMPLGVTSGALGVLTCVTAIVAMVRWTSSSDSAMPLTVLVLSFGAAAVATGVPARRASRDDAEGGGFALAGILMGVLGIVATIGYIVLSLVFVILMYFIAAMAMTGADGTESLVGAVLGPGLQSA